ncbi:MAG: single-stranded-DNA-specific exonuclease RecJ [Patescibacteria group bacterium]|mgnify:CR=1 FL=1
MDKRWVVAEPISSEISATFPELHPSIVQVLWNRGLRSQEEMDIFLSPDWSRDVFSPFEFTRMQEAVDRVFAALASGEMITVHGDYDADGVCGSTVLMSTLREVSRALDLTTQTSVFLPHREKDGYGLSLKTVEHLHENEKTKLIITVDCGISNGGAIARAKELGIDAIVCDHHQMPEVLPEGAILLHPLVPGETYPNKKLCGTGVAFKLACGLIHEARKQGANFPEGYEKWLLDLVAIATVTDVMPLIGENRTLEKYGLVVLNKTRRPGLQALIKAAGIEDKDLDTWSIGFQLGPRINAAGRMNHANAAYNLLMVEDPAEAEQLALALNLSNTDRQKASEELYQLAKQQLGVAGERKILFAVGDGWSIGLAGLVAGKLMNDYGLPVFVICKLEAGHYAASGRSLHGFDVTAAMKTCGQYLMKFGGHPQACGMSCADEENLTAFMAAMSDQAATYFLKKDATPTIQIDGELDPKRVDWDLVSGLHDLEPFGEAHPRPLFVAYGLTLNAFDTVGSDKQHLRLTAGGKKMIGFRFGEWVQKLTINDKIDVVYEIGVNEWNGNKEIQLRIVDLRLCQNT